MKQIITPITTKVKLVKAVTGTAAASLHQSKEDIRVSRKSNKKSYLSVNGR